MKRLGALFFFCIAATLFVAVSSQAQTTCVVCRGMNCPQVSSGFCDCAPACTYDPETHKETCSCINVNVCGSTPVRDGDTPDFICEGAIGQRPGKTCARPISDQVIRDYPWIASDAFARAIRAESIIPEESYAMIAGLQKIAAKKGLSSEMLAQTAEYIGDKNADPPHLSKLVGVIAKLQKDGSYLLSFYRDIPGPGGETKYLSVKDMEKDNVEPLETVVVKGNHYVHTLQAGVREGDF
jgi:hypothetical protein